MSASSTPVSGNALTPQQRVSLNSSITNIILDSDNGNSSFLVRTGSVNSLYIDTNSNVGVNTNSPTAQLEVASGNGACLRLRYGSSATAYSDIFTTSDGDLTIAPNTGSVRINSALTITGNVTLSGTLTMSGGGSLAESLSMIDAGSAGTAVASKALVVDSNRTIVNINSLGVSSLSVGSSVISAADASRLSGLSAGTGLASKALVLDSLGSIAGITSITAQSLYGVMQTSSQPNIQLVGTLSSLNVGGSTVISSTNDAVSAANGGALTVSGGLAVAKNVYIGGNLFVNGSTTSVNSTNISIADNAIVLNASPSAPRDSGVLIQRYQTNNDTSAGSVVLDTPASTLSVVSATSQTVTLGAGASDTNDYYTGWWVLVNTQSRKVISYDGSSKVITVESGLTIAPTAGAPIKLYNKSYATLIWDESDGTFRCAFSSADPSSTYVHAGDASFSAGYITSPSVLVSDAVDSTTATTGALRVSGGVGIAKSLNVGTGIYGTIKSPIQTEITALGTLSTLTVSDTTPTSSATVNLVSNVAGAIGIRGSAFATDPSTFYIAYNGANRLLIDASGSVAIGTSSFGYKLSVGGSFNASSIAVGGTSLATNLISGAITPGTAASGKVLTTDSNLDVGGINNLTVSSALKIGASSFGPTELSYLTGISVGSATFGKALVPDSSKAISGLSSITLSNSSPSGVVSQSYASDTQTFVAGVQGSGTSISASSYYWYFNGSYRLFMNTTGSVAIGISTVDASTFNYKLNVGGSLNASSYYVDGALVNLGIIQSLTPGVATASKALVVDSSRDITNVNSLTVSNLKIGSSTLTSAELGYITGVAAGAATAGKALIVDSSKNISGIGELSVDSLMVAGQSVLTSNSGSFAYIQNVVEGTAGASKALVTDTNKDIQGIRRLGVSDSSTAGAGMITIASNSNSLVLGARGSANASGADLAFISYGGSDRLTMSADGNVAIGSVGVSTYKLNVGGSINATSFFLNDTQLVLDNLSFLSGAIAGTAAPNKALILDSSSSVTSINSLTADKLVASSSLKVGSSTITFEAGYLAGSTQGTATNGKVLVLNSSGSVTGINNIGATSITIGGASLNATTLGYLSGVALAGSAVAGKVLTTDSNNSVSGINNITAQSLTLNGAVLSSSLFDAINGVTAGQISPNKALIFDSSSSLSFGTSKISFANSMFTLSTTQSSDTNYTVFQRWINDVSTDVVADISVSNLAFRFGTYSNHALRLMTNNSTKVYIDTLGNVGIGDVSPQYMLDVAGTVRSAQLSNYTPASGTITTSSTLGSYGLVLGTSSGATGTQGQSAIAFVNNTTALATATPSAAIVLERPSNNTGSLLFFTKGTNTGTAAITERMRITAAGNVGIGNAAPAYQLDLGSTGTGINTTAIRYDTSNAASPAIGAMLVVPYSFTPSIAVSSSFIDRTSSDQLVAVPSAAPTTSVFLLYTSNLSAGTFAAIALSGAALTNFTPTTGLTCTINALWVSPTNTIWVGGTLSKTGYSKAFLFSGTTAGITDSYIHGLASSSTVGLGAIAVSGQSDANVVVLVQTTATNAHVYYRTSGAAFANTGSVASTYTNVKYVAELSRYILSTTASSLYYMPQPTSTVVLTACTTPSSTAAIAAVCYNSKIGAAFAFASSLVWSSSDGITWTSVSTSSTNNQVINDTVNGAIIVLRDSAMIYFTSTSSSTTYPFTQLFATGTPLRNIITPDSGNRIFGFKANSSGMQWFRVFAPSYYSSYAELGYLNHAGNFGHKWHYGSYDGVCNKQLMSVDPISGLTVGNADSTCNNIITFGGTSGDTPDPANLSYHTVIAERIFNGTDNSELLLLKGNDATDRIRFRAPNHCFQIATDTFANLGDNNTILYVSNNGGVGIRNENPQCALHVVAIDSSGTNWGSVQRLEYGGSGTLLEAQVKHDTGDSAFGTRSAHTFALTTNNLRRLFIDANGNVGIGTTTPSYNLDVSGAIRASGDVHVSASIGIRTTYPQAPLHIMGAQSSGANWTQIQRWEYGSSGTLIETQVRHDTGDAVIGTRSAHTFALITNNIRRLTADTSGNVGIATTTPSYKLDVSGTVRTTENLYVGWGVAIGGTDTSGYGLKVTSRGGTRGTANYRYYTYDTNGSQITAAASDISIYSEGRIFCNGELDVASDKRIKKDIRELSDEYCDRLLSVKPCMYKLKSDDSLCLGFIAQDMLMHELGELITLTESAEDENLIHLEEDGIVSHAGTKYGVNYNGVLPIPLNLVKRNKASTEALQSENTALKEQVSALEERLAKLERLLA